MVSSRSTRRRLALTIIAVFAIVVVFSIRLVDIQVVQAKALTAKAVANRSLPVTTYGTRGEIVDTNGVVLADSVDRFDITAAPNIVPANGKLTIMIGPNGKFEKVSVADALSAIAAITGQSVTDLSTTLLANPKANWALLTKAVKLDVFTKVQRLRIPWVFDELRPSRSYPNGAIAGNLVGFIGTDGPQAGIEYTQNKCLASSNGKSTYERGEDGVRIPGSTVTQTQPKDGGTVKLTIDRDLQWFVQQAVDKQAKAIGAKWATAIVVRVKDAHLLAVADWPTVDPNNVNAAKRTALGSRAFSTPYEPGSTFKAMSMASLLDAGVVHPEDHIIVPGRMTFPGGDYITDDWAHGDLRYTPATVIENSSNVGISLLSKRLSAQKRHDYMAKFGVGSKTAVNFNGESAGIFSPASQWDPVTSRTVEFGQGVSATSAQVASIYQTLANGGVRTPLTLVEGCVQPDGTVTEKPSTTGTRVVSQQAASETLRMMETVVTGGWLSADLKIPGYRVAAKSGTAEVPATNGNGYTAQRVVSLAGIAPADNPQYVVVATFGEPDTIKTSAAAAPTFQKIMTQVLKKYRVVPSRKPAPPIALSW
ncbi:MAG: ftsI [Glaciihabitans sp.]|nr:ftsI [Glaciihabitans sp.]